MRRLRWILVAAATASPGCTVPDTLGLPCTSHSHCNSGQYCNPEQACAQGTAPAGSSSTTESPTQTPTNTGSSSAPTDPTTGSSGPTSGEGSTTTTSSESSTGAACGQAIGTCDALDLLFVVDNSGSMEEDNQFLIPALTSAQALLLSQLDGMCSYHIGVTTTETAPNFQPEECQQRGALLRAGVLCRSPWGDPEHVPWVSEEDDLNTLGCLFGVGQREDDDEKQLETTLAAIGPELGAPGACNEGFVREGVPLVIVLITDEDDDDDSSTESANRTGSAGDPDQWWDDLTAIKEPRELAVVLVGGLTPGGCDWNPLGGSDDGEGAEFAQNILDFMGYFIASGYSDHQVSADLCEPKRLIDEITIIDEVLTTVCQDAAR